MDVTEVVDQAGALVALAAGVAFVLLLPLYFSQRRDLKRLVAWMEREPEHPAQDTSASEVLLDRAEAELEELTATEPVAPPSSAAQRVTSERPALERLTMEREALVPHPRWRRFAARVSQPRWLILIATAAVVLAGVGIVGSQVLLETDDPEPRGTGPDTSNVTVAVLNGTSVSGLGAKVGDDVTASGFSLGAVSTFPRQAEQTVVLYEDGFRSAARRLAGNLGSVPAQPIDAQAQRLADGANVVVVAGADRAGGG